MKLISYSSFANDLFIRGPEYAAAHSAQLGFDGVEIYADCFAGTRADGKEPPAFYECYPLEKMRDVLARNGLQVACYSIGVNLLTANEQVLFQQMEQHIAYAAAIGSPHLHHTVIPWLIRPEGAPSYDEALQAVLPKARHIANMCAQYGINCLYEPQGVYFNGVQGLGRFLQEMRSTCPNVFVCADTGNPLFVQEEPDAVLRSVAHLVRHAHIKDYTVVSAPQNGAGMKMADGNFVTDAPLGKGVINLQACWQALRQQGYNGNVALEFICNDELMRSSMEFVRRLFAGSAC